MVKKKEFLTVELILKQLEELYALALVQENLNLAVRIKELQGRSLGLFHSSELTSISNLSETNLKNLIKQLQDSLAKN